MVVNLDPYIDSNKLSTSRSLGTSTKASRSVCNLCLLSRICGNETGPTSGLKTELWCQIPALPKWPHDAIGHVGTDRTLKPFNKFVPQYVE